MCWRVRVVIRLFDVEFGIDWDLEGGGEGVGLGGHADDGEEFGVLVVGEAFGSGGGGVGVDAVGAAVGGGDGDVDELLGERVEGAGLDHDLLDAGPGALEDSGLVGEGSPEVVDEVGVARGADVVEDGFDAGIGGYLFVGPEFLGGHEGPFWLQVVGCRLSVDRCWLRVLLFSEDIGCLGLGVFGLRCCGVICGGGFWYRPKSPMPFWKLTVAYDGTPYHGWQVQPGLPTVQGTLARVIHSITGEEVLPQGSGRTDTGVHALGQVASFALASPIPGANLKRALNHALPASIRVVAVDEVGAAFHARHSARRKTYEYRIATQPVCLPMLAPFVWNCTWPMELDAMNEAAACVVGTHDFTSFAATDPELSVREGEDAGDAVAKSAVRTIFRSAWRREGELLVYRVTGSGFLHHMVRNLVGTFVDVGRGRTAASAVPGMIAARMRSAAGPTAPPQGLFLVDVEYETGHEIER